MSIGVFDSGVGGLTVLRRVMRVLPREKFIYFGDTKRAPYGNRGRKRILKQSLQSARFLSEFDLDMAIIACNTISSVCYKELKMTFGIPLLSIAEAAAAAVKEAAAAGAGKIGVIATKATLKSGIYKKSEICGAACPKLVVLAEQGLHGTEAARKQTMEYLRPLKNQNISALLLGCTHFPLFEDFIRRYLGNDIPIIDPAALIAEKAKTIANSNELIANSYDFYVSGDNILFDEIAENILGIQVKSRRINIDKY